MNIQMPVSLSLSFPKLKYSKRKCLPVSLSLGFPKLTYSKHKCLNAQTTATTKKKMTGVIIIGAGLAGLAAATRLNSQGIPFLILEASDAVGGRVRTDLVDGFLLDRGFQIFITAYPEARKLLDYDALDLKKFYSGAQVYYNGGFHTVADPLHHFRDALMSLTNPIGSVFDKALIAITRIRVLSKSDNALLSAPEVSTNVLLKSIGFSASMVDRFFRPFFGGIFFDKELETTSRLFDFIFKCLSLGDNTLPSKGIGEIPNQLAKKLPSGSILLNTEAVSIEFNNVVLQGGETLSAELGVILAVEEPQAYKLLKGKRPMDTKSCRSTICLYFTADPSQIPVEDPVLFLNGSGSGIVNNMFFVTNVSPSYGNDKKKALVSVSLVGWFEDKSDDELKGEVLDELSSWFDESMVKSWTHLRTYRIKFAQPNQSPPTDLNKNPRLGQDGIYQCGDYMTSATFDGALVSGRRAVEALLRDNNKA